MIKKGNMVKMVDCMEANQYKDQLWKVSGEPYILSKDTEVVKLRGFAGCFSTEKLEVVKEEESSSK